MPVHIEGPATTLVGRQTGFMVLPGEQREYRWKVTGGRIVEGQDMPVITVEWEQEGHHHVSVEVLNYRGEVEKDKILVTVDQPARG